MHAAHEGGYGAAEREALFTTYWPPVYGYIRKSGVDPELARDLTQDFFVFVLEGQLLGKADRERGRFRAFIKTCLQRFLIDQHRRNSAAKRGGNVARYSLDATQTDADQGLAGVLADPGQSPNEALDTLWRRQLVEGALERVRREFNASGHELSYQVFAEFFLADEQLDYETIAIRHGCTKTDVSNHLRRAKLRYRARLETMVMQTVEDPDELEQELCWLFGKERRE